MQFIKDIYNEMNHTALVIAMVVVILLILFPFVSIVQTIVLTLFCLFIISIIGYGVYCGVEYFIEEIKESYEYRHRRDKRR